jgi:hypothetical protein
MSLAGQDNLSEARIAEFEFNNALCSSSDKPWLRLITTDESLGTAIELVAPTGQGGSDGVLQSFPVVSEQVVPLFRADFSLLNPSVLGVEQVLLGEITIAGREGPW